ncbi:MAG: hypothetical protein WD673_10720, partial [Alphaproteobacteria bacterium]
VPQARVANRVASANRTAVELRPAMTTKGMSMSRRPSSDPFGAEASHEHAIGPKPNRTAVGRMRAATGHPVQQPDDWALDFRFAALAAPGNDN